MSSDFHRATWLSFAAILWSSTAAWGAVAIQNGNIITISRPNTTFGGATEVAGSYANTDAANGGYLLGGEFRIVGPGPASDAEVFKTFCLEYQEHISLNANYFATIDDRAINGGVGADSGNPLGDPLSTATKWFYSSYRNNTLDDTGFQYDVADWADALQLVLWRLENEVQPLAWKLSNPIDGEIYGINSGNVLENANSLWGYYTGHQSAIDNSTDVNLSRVKVINLWNGYNPTTGVPSGADQSQLYYDDNSLQFGPPVVPEPASFVAWSLGLMIAGLAYLARRKK